MNPNVLVVGDRFIPSSTFVEALRGRLGAEAKVEAIDWSIDKTRQHEDQQIMELAGANAVAPIPEALAAVSDAEVLCVHFAPVGRAMMDAAPRLRAIVVARAGLENVDLEYAAQRGIVVSGVRGRNAAAVAELQLGLMLSQSRSITAADRSVRSGGWQTDFGRTPHEVAGSVVGMVGFGQVGRAFATLLSGFSAHLLAFDPFVAAEELASFGIGSVSTPLELASQADFLVLQARYSPATERIIGAAEISAMKPTAFLINVARSRLVDTDALLAALTAGTIGGAGLDVHDAEPLPVDSPWRSLPNVTLTTHFGGDTVNTNETSARLVADEVAAQAASWTTDGRTYDG